MEQGTFVLAFGFLRSRWLCILRADAHAEGTWKRHLDSKREVQVFAG